MTFHFKGLYALLVCLHDDPAFTANVVTGHPRPRALILLRNEFLLCYECYDFSVILRGEQTPCRLPSLDRISSLAALLFQNR